MTEIKAGRADVNAMMVRFAKSMSDDRAEARQRMASGGDATHRYDEVDQIAVIERKLPPLLNDPFKEPRVMWETLNLPFGLDQIKVISTHSDASRNGWSMREIMTRRLHRAYRDALINGKVMGYELAARRARHAQIYVAE